jgi:hypothetical protein
MTLPNSAIDGCLLRMTIPNPAIEGCREKELLR